MITLGVDLAAEPAGTGMATIEWRDGAAQLVDLGVGVTNEMIVGAAAGVDKLGIDCAFGWPIEFVDFVSRQSQGLPLAPSTDSGMAWRRRLAYRETDRFVHHRVGKLPLSVAADRLGLTAMRCAVILDEIGASGIAIDRAGAGRLVEVYPAAALKVWTIAASGSKRTSTGLGELVDGLQRAAPWLDLGEAVDLLRRSHDAFDSVIASLIARSSALGFAFAPPEPMREQASREGWIAVPTEPLGALV